MRFFVFLHVLSMVTAVGLGYAPMFVMRRAMATRNVPTIRAVFGMSKPLGITVPIFFFTGLGFAILAIITEGFNPLRPWLLIAYVLFTIGVGLGAGVTGPYVGRVADLAAASPDATPSPELRAIMDDPRSTLVFYSELTVVVLILFDMILKPFGA